MFGSMKAWEGGKRLVLKGQFVIRPEEIKAIEGAKIATENRQENRST